MEFRPSEDEQKSLNELSERKKILFDEYSKIKDPLAAKLHELRLLSEEHPDDKELEISHKKAITEFGEAGNAYYQKIKGLETEMKKIRDQSNRRQFKQFNDDPQKILEDAKSYASSYIITVSSFLSARVVDDVDYWLRDATILRGDDGFYLLNIARTKSEIEQHLYLHLEILQNWRDHLNQLNDHIDYALSNAELIEPHGQLTKNGSTIKTNSLLPKTNYILNNKAGINLPAIVGKGIFDLNVAPINKKEVLTKINIDYADTNIKLPPNFTPYDRAVVNAYVSWWVAGNTEFTPSQIYRCMNGMTDKETVSPQSIGAITRSLDKCRRLLCSIDYTAEAEMYNKETKSCVVEDYILNAKKVKLETGGKIITGYQFNGPPILYSYAQISGQIVNIPAKLFNTSSVVRSTSENIVMREYLLRRIEIMKKGKSQNNKILYETLFECIGEETPNSDRIKTVRGYIKKMLSYYVKEKYINEFEEYKNGRTFVGVRIFY